MTTSISHLSSEIFSALSHFNDASDLIELYFCGNKRLNYALSRSVTCFRLDWVLPHRQPLEAVCATVTALFPRVTTLDIYSTISGHVKIESKLPNLPKNLTSLSLNYGSAAHVFGPESDLRQLLPLLRSIKVADATAKQPQLEWLRTLPSSTTSLKLNRRIFGLNILLLDTLPSQLTALKLSCSPKDLTTLQLAHLPLESVSLNFSNIKSEDELAMKWDFLPSTLTRLKLSGFVLATSDFKAPSSWRNLFPHLVSLAVSHHLIQDVAVGQVADFPVTLKKIKTNLPRLPLPSSWLPLLAKHHALFDISASTSLDFKTLRLLPHLRAARMATDLDWTSFYFPPCLTKLSLSLMEYEKMPLLPSTLTYLHCVIHRPPKDAERFLMPQNLECLMIRFDVVGADIPFCFDLLPPKLVNLHVWILHLSNDISEFKLPFVGDLSHLTRLKQFFMHTGSDMANIGFPFESVFVLPPSLEILTLPQPFNFSDSFWTSFGTHFSNLKSLSITGASSDIFLHLPPSLTILRARLLSGTINSSHIRALPPHLKLLNLSGPWKVYPEDYSEFAHLPRRLKDLRLLNDGDGTDLGPLANHIPVPIHTVHFNETLSSVYQARTLEYYEKKALKTVNVLA